MDSIIVLNTGGMTAHAVARRIRALRVYARLIDAAEYDPDLHAEAVRGIVLAGSGVKLTPDAPPLDRIADAGVPVLAFGRCARLLLSRLGGKPVMPIIEKHTALVEFLPSKLFEGLERAERYFDRADELELPEGISVVARAGDTEWTAAFTDDARALYGTQFSVEQNDPDGMAILRNFALKICGCREEWTMEAFAAAEVKRLRERVPQGNIVCAVSGGLNSAVSAALAMRAFGERARCVFVDTGLMRKDERKLVKRVYEEEIGVALTVLDIRDCMLAALANIENAKEKICVTSRTLADALCTEDCVSVVRGELFSAFSPAPQDGNDRALYPLRELFREEARELGELLGLPKELLSRQPFPESGFAARVGGEVTPRKLDTLREADALFRVEIADASLDKKIWQYYATLARTDGGDAVILHAFTSADALTGSAYRLPYDLLERVTSRILKADLNVDAVFYDLSEGLKKNGV